MIRFFDIIGSIRVYCRVRPFLQGQSDEASTIDYIGENGNLMIVHPHKQGRDARKVFSFNKVFGTNATQRNISILPALASILVCFVVYIHFLALWRV